MDSDLRGCDRKFVCPFAGECCHAAEPGWFRACYAWMEADGALDAMVDRISEHVASLKLKN